LPRRVGSPRTGCRACRACPLGSLARLLMHGDRRDAPARKPPLVYGKTRSEPENTNQTILVRAFQCVPSPPTAGTSAQPAMAPFRHPPPPPPPHTPHPPLMWSAPASGQTPRQAHKRGCSGHAPTRQPCLQARQSEMCGRARRHNDHSSRSRVPTRSDSAQLMLWKSRMRLWRAFARAEKLNPTNWCGHQCTRNHAFRAPERNACTHTDARATVCAVGPGDPISLEVCEHHTLPRGEQECFRITADKRCARPSDAPADRRRARGALRACVRSCCAVHSASVGAPVRSVPSVRFAFGAGRVVADEVGMADGIEDLVIVLPYADVTAIQVGAHAAHARRSMGRVCLGRTDDMGQGAYVGSYVSTCAQPFTHARTHARTHTARPVRG
jgi:hypothetical protein